tara:strand:+ start:6100 stop:6294 length:195 start_codon:yes stop_codon:yes gene_type:complete
MKVVITPSFPRELDSSEMLIVRDIFDDLKEESLISASMNISEFKELCFQRGLNDYRKDLSMTNC